MLLYKTQFDYNMGGSNPNNHIAIYNPNQINLANGTGNPWSISTESLLGMYNENLQTWGDLRLGSIGIQDGELTTTLQLSEYTKTRIYLRDTQNYNSTNAFYIELKDKELAIYKVNNAKPLAYCDTLSENYGEDITIQIRFVLSTCYVFVNGVLKLYTNTMFYGTSSQAALYAWLSVSPNTAPSIGSYRRHIVLKTWNAGNYITLDLTTPFGHSHGDAGANATTITEAHEAIKTMLDYFVTQVGHDITVSYIDASDHSRGVIVLAGSAMTLTHTSAGAWPRAIMSWTSLVVGSLSLDSYFNKMAQNTFGQSLYAVQSINQLYSDVADLVADVKYASSSNKLQSAVQKAIMEIWNSEDWPEREVIDYIPLVDGEQVYSLPEHVGEIYALFYDGQQIDVVKSRGPYIFQNLTSGSGQRCQVDLRQGNLRIFPAPVIKTSKSFGVLEIHHRIKTPYLMDNTSGAFLFAVAWNQYDIPALNMDALEAIKFRAALWLMATIRDYDSGAYQDTLQKFQAKLNDARRASIKTTKLPNQMRIPMR